MIIDGTNLSMIRGDTESIALSCVDINSVPVPPVNSSNTTLKGPITWGQLKGV